MMKAVLLSALCGFSLSLQPTRTRRALLSSGAGAALVGVAAPPALGAPKEEEIRPFKGGADKRSGEVVINVNTATGSMFTDCPGMYPTIAGRIVDHVRRSGKIKSFKELLATEDVIQDNENIKAILKRNEARLRFD